MEISESIQKSFQITANNTTLKTRVRFNFFSLVTRDCLFCAIKRWVVQQIIKLMKIVKINCQQRLTY